MQVLIADAIALLLIKREVGATVFRPRIRPRPVAWAVLAQIRPELWARYDSADGLRNRRSGVRISPGASNESPAKAGFLFSRARAARRQCPYGALLSGAVRRRGEGFAQASRAVLAPVNAVCDHGHAGHQRTVMLPCSVA
jgi:hypothetical protein